MPVNVKLLKKVRKLIAEEPKRLMMCVWGRKAKANDEVSPPCGTVACLAGWTILASQPRKEWKNIITAEEYSIVNFAARKGDYLDPVSGLAAELLGISLGECPFYRREWKAPEVLAWIDRQVDAASK